VTVAFLGINANLEGRGDAGDLPGFKGGDRTTLDLPAGQERLLEAAIATRKPVGGGGCKAGAPISAEFCRAECGGSARKRGMAARPPARPSQRRWPATTIRRGGCRSRFTKSVDQIPPFEDYSMQGRTYKYFKGQALYPFGFGLSYSSFVYSNLSVTPVAGAAGQFNVTANVKNDSARDGRRSHRSVREPRRGCDRSDSRALRDSSAFICRAGQARDVQFTVALTTPPGAPDSASGAQAATAAGTITFSVGAGSRCRERISSSPQSNRRRLALPRNRE